MSALGSPPHPLAVTDPRSLSGFYAVSFVLLGGPYETTFTITWLLAMMQVALLLTPPVLSYIFGEDKAVASQ
jgi:hypothetical protein